MKHFKTSGELFDELERVVRLYTAVALVIYRPSASHTDMIFAGDGHPGARLLAINRLLDDGGQPLGFMAINARGQVLSWPLPNYKDRPDILAFLAEVERQSRMTLIASASLDDFAHA